MEAWTLKKSDVDQIQASELWIYRRTTKISGMQRKINEEVPRGTKKVVETN